MQLVHTTVVKQTIQNSPAYEDADPVGISLAGNHPGSSPSEGDNEPPLTPPVDQFTERDSEQASAAEMNVKIAQHLESEGRKW